MAEIQFVPGFNETVIPNVRLTRSKDGNSGRAIFTFENPAVFQNEEATGIDGMYMSDEEGELMTRQVSAKFINGQPSSLVATYIMKNPQEWDRFMRFMNRYAEAHGLGLSKSGE